MINMLYSGLLLGLLSGTVLVFGSIWVALDFFGLSLNEVAAVADFVGVFIVALVATHFTAVNDYRAQLILAVKYTVPVLLFCTVTLI